MSTNNATAPRAFRKLELKQHSAVYKFINKLCKCPYVLVAPAVLLSLWLTIVPMIFVIYVSFFNWDLMTNTMTFIGLSNYKFIFTSEPFIKSIINTIIFMLATVIGGTILKVLVGVFLNRNTKRHNLVQTIIFTPHIISSVAVATVFMYIMRPEGGLLNTVLGVFGIEPLGWYLAPETSLLSIIIITIWQTLGYGALIVISGLKSIPDYVYEAARLDKSSRVNTFFRITVPLLSPTLLYLLVTTTLTAFTSFDVVKLMTDGGPNNSSSIIAHYIYQQGFTFMHYGRAMAAAVVLLVITVSLSLLNFKLAGKKIHYQ